MTEEVDEIVANDINYFDNVDVDEVDVFDAVETVDISNKAIDIYMQWKSIWMLSRWIHHLKN